MSFYVLLVSLRNTWEIHKSLQRQRQPGTSISKSNRRLQKRQVDLDIAHLDGFLHENLRVHGFKKQQKKMGRHLKLLEKSFQTSLPLIL